MASKLNRTKNDKNQGTRKKFLEIIKLYFSTYMIIYFSAVAAYEFQIPERFMILSILFSLFVIIACFTFWFRFFKKAFNDRNDLSIHIIISSILLLITSFSLIFSVIYFFDPTSFSGIRSNVSFTDTYIDFFYLSTATLTTVGFGDIHPFSSLAKVAAIIEMCVFLIGIVLGINFYSKKAAFDKVANTISDKGTKSDSDDVILASDIVKHQVQIEEKSSKKSQKDHHANDH